MQAGTVVAEPRDTLDRRLEPRMTVLRRATPARHGTSFDATAVRAT